MGRKVELEPSSDRLTSTHLYGPHASLPVEITASNLGHLAIQLTRPDQALKLEIETGGATVPGRLACDESVTVRQRAGGASLSIEDVRSEVIALSPGDSMTASCEVVR